MTQKQQVFGLLAPTCTGRARTVWNAMLREKGMDGFFDFYRTETVRDLEDRLSEMFLLERRGYLIAPIFSSAVIELLDALDESAVQKGSVDSVVNDDGVLRGFFCDDAEKTLSVWSARDTLRS